MKKTLILALVAVFAFAGSAFASASIGGSLDLKYELELGTDWTTTVTPEATVTFEAGEEGVWSLSAEIADIFDDISLGDYKVKVTDEMFTLVAWTGDSDEGDLGDPIGLVSASEEADNALRVTSSAFGLDLSSQLVGDDLYLFGETAVDGNTLGAGAKLHFDAADKYNELVGYGTLNLDPITIDVAAASTSQADTKNTAFGIAAEVDLGGGVTVNGSYTQKAENFDNEKAYSAGADYEVDTIKAGGSYEYSSAVSSEANATVTLSGDVTLVGAAVPDWDDAVAYDEYMNNATWAVKAEASSTSKPNDADDANPTTVFAVTGTMPVTADVFWVYGKLTLTSDKDGLDSGAESETKLEGRGYYKFNDKLSSETYVINLSSGGDSETTIGTGLTYAVADGIELSAGYKQVSETGQDTTSTITLEVSADF